MVFLSMRGGPFTADFAVQQLFLQTGDLRGLNAESTLDGIPTGSPLTLAGQIHRRGNFQREPTDSLTGYYRNTKVEARGRRPARFRLSPIRDVRGSEGADSAPDSERGRQHEFARIVE